MKSSLYIWEFLPFIITVIAGILTAWLSQRFFKAKKIWVGYFLILSSTAVFLGLAGRVHTLAISSGTWPIVWHNNLFLVNAFLFASIFWILSVQWPHKSSRSLIFLLSLVTILRLSILPGYGWVLTYPDWTQSDTLIDEDGVCRQTTTFSCGPAATVTALLQLQIFSSEAELAVAAKTSQFSGTQPLNLKQAIDKLLGDKYLIKTKILTPDKASQIPSGSPSVALVKHSAFENHYVCVLDVGESQILVADPEMGFRVYTHKEFDKIFRGLIIQIGRLEESSFV